MSTNWRMHPRPTARLEEPALTPGAGDWSEYLARNATFQGMRRDPTTPAWRGGATV